MALSTVRKSPALSGEAPVKPHGMTEQSGHGAVTTQRRAVHFNKISRNPVPGLFEFINMACQPAFACTGGPAGNSRNSSDIFGKISVYSLEMLPLG